MKILLVDEVCSRATELLERVRGEKHDVTLCAVTNDFLNAVQDAPADAILLDMGTWQRGRSIYEYFEAASRFADTPVVFYNAPEDFLELAHRRKLDKDVVLPMPSSVDTVAESVLSLA